MANYTPMTGSEKKPPYTPVFRDQQPGGGEGSFYAWDQNGLMWIWTKVRRRAYVCSRGETHNQYWRTHWDQGTHDYVVCDHEIKHAMGEALDIKEQS